MNLSHLQALRIHNQDVETTLLLMVDGVRISLLKINIGTLHLFGVDLSVVDTRFPVLPRQLEPNFYPKLAQ